MQGVPFPIRRGYADTPLGQVHYRAAGARELPVLVFLHQTASSGAMWELVMANLAARFHCIALDTPGFGGSFQPEAIPDLGWCADRLIEALDAIGVGRFALGGHHTGGCIALEMAERLGSRLTALSIIGPVVANEAEKAEYRKTFVRPFAVEPSGAFLQKAWDYLGAIGAGANVALHTREMIDHLVAHHTMPMAFAAVWEQDVEALLRAVACPLQLVCSREDVLWPLFERARAIRPEAAVAIVGGFDFQPDRDPDGVARALGDFFSATDGET